MLPAMRLATLRLHFELEKALMSHNKVADEEWPCPHCLIVELIDEFIAENSIEAGGQNAIDTDEVINAVAKYDGRTDFEPR